MNLADFRFLLDIMDKGWDYAVAYAHPPVWN